jgi:hypothetical protein
MRQWEVARELRARVKAALDAAGIQPAGPDTIVVSAPPGPAGQEPQPGPAAVAAIPADTRTEDRMATAQKDPLADTELPAATEERRVTTELPDDGEGTGPRTP